MKRIVSLAAALALCLSMLPLNGAFAAQEVVNVFNCYDYMDETVFDIFEQETGIHVNKMYYTGNEDMMVQVRVSPGAYDVVIPSD
ncbi:MAG: spermidine/putrescine ABC transporter substrate-binding protein, partial [Clostridia bacterium]|nr:spermidine/putrescine ABC transporter substrate-binding protein [Clostridia bacterium]